MSFMSWPTKGLVFLVWSAHQAGEQPVSWRFLDTRSQRDAVSPNSTRFRISRRAHTLTETEQAGCRKVWFKDETGVQGFEVGVEGLRVWGFHFPHKPYTPESAISCPNRLKLHAP